MTAKKETPSRIEEVTAPVEGTVVDWEHNTQINPVTGEVYDFHGKLISPAVKE